jgi:hypothetical protein
VSYSEQNKLIAKAHVAAIRKKTFCIHCGNQPIEWHNEEYEINSNRRVALGFPVSVIDEEISKCEAVCRSCHMEFDRRTGELLAAAPQQKGYSEPPILCSNCGLETKPNWRGMCRRCYDYQRRH